MGKLKKNSRSSRHRRTPIASNDNNNNPTSKQDENLTRTKILPLIKQLSSTSSNDRSMALGAISVLADDPKFRSLLLKEKLLQIVLEQSLSDSNSEIIVEAFGLLRNFVIEEGYDVSIYLWRQGIWKSIETNFEKAKISFDSFIQGKISKIEKNLLFDYIENLISLIVGLADSSDDIFEQILNKIDPIVKFIKEILQFSINDKKHLKINVNLFNSILDFIYDFSSQSETFINSLSSRYDLKFDSLYLIINDIPRLNQLSKIYIEGIKLQLSESSLTSNDIIKIIHNLIENIKDIDFEQVKSIIYKNLDNTKPEDLNKDAKIRVEARSKLQAIELSLEIITAISEIIAFQNTSNNSKNKFNDDSLINILITDIPKILLNLLKYQEFKSRSLTALNNLSWLFITTDLFNEQWLQSSTEIWNTILSIQNDYDIEEKISLFGTLWAILIVNIDGIQISDEFISNTIEELKKTLTQDIENELKEEYLIRLIGVLGSISKKQGFIERNLIISSLFIELIEQAPNTTTSSRLIVEILDTFYEIYGDYEFDYDGPVFIERNYLNKLIELTPKIKSSVKLIDRNVNPELKAKADDVFNNLSRFIKYKESER